MLPAFRLPSATRFLNIILVFQEHAEGILDCLFVERLALERHQCLCPIQRFGNAGELVQVLLAQILNKGDDLMCELIGTGMLGVPVLAGSSAYAIAEASAWRGSLEKKPRSARHFYTVLAAALVGGLAIDFAGFDAVKMMFWSAVVNGALAPPLLLLLVLLTSNGRVMGERVNPPILRILGWITFVLISVATIGMLVS